MAQGPDLCLIDYLISHSANYSYFGKYKRELYMIELLTAANSLVPLHMPCIGQMHC